MIYDLADETNEITAEDAMKEEEATKLILPEEPLPFDDEDYDLALQADFQAPAEDQEENSMIGKRYEFKDSNRIFWTIYYEHDGGIHNINFRSEEWEPRQTIRITEVDEDMESSQEMTVNQIMMTIAHYLSMTALRFASGPRDVREV